MTFASLLEIKQYQFYHWDIKELSNWLNWLTDLISYVFLNQLFGAITFLFIARIVYANIVSINQLEEKAELNSDVGRGGGWGGGEEKWKRGVRGYGLSTALINIFTPMMQQYGSRNEESKTRRKDAPMHRCTWLIARYSSWRFWTRFRQTMIIIESIHI